MVASLTMPAMDAALDLWLSSRSLTDLSYPAAAPPCRYSSNS
jgi:hypothetical protein